MKFKLKDCVVALGSKKGIVVMCGTDFAGEIYLVRQQFENAVSERWYRPGELTIA